jgi:hypothetical protein
MAKPKLKVGDEVAVLELEQTGEGRKRHRVKIAKVKSKNGRKVKVEDDEDEFGEEGDNPEKPKKRLLKLTAKIMKRISKSPLIGGKGKIKSLRIDDSLLKALDSENDEP